MLILIVCASQQARAAFLFVSAFDENRVYQIDVSDGSTVMTYSDPLFLDSPTDLALSPDGSTLYVGATNQSNADVYLFDTTTGSRIGEFSDLNNLSGARGTALTADGSTLYVSGINVVCQWHQH